jgi:thiamine transporter ThiT
MKTMVIVVGFVIIVALGFVASFKGLDLRKWSSWLYGAISFLCGLAVGFSLTSNWVEGLKGGVLFGFLLLATGAVMRWHKQRYGGPG